MHVCSPIFSSSFLIIKMQILWFFSHLSMSESVNNIKIICSIRFSLLITIDRFYKLFCRGCFCESSTWYDLPHSLSFRQNPIRLAPLATFPTREGFVGGIVFPHMRVFALTMREKRYPRIVAFPIGKALPGERYSRFFIRPTQKRPSLTSGRFYVYYLLRETLIKSQNSISHVFSCNASSYSSLNSSLFASKYSLHCMKI